MYLTCNISFMHGDQGCKKTEIIMFQVTAKVEKIKDLNKVLKTKTHVQNYTDDRN